MASSNSQIDKPQWRAELPDVNINTGTQNINTKSFFKFQWQCPTLPFYSYCTLQAAFIQQETRNLLWLFRPGFLCTFLVWCKGCFIRSLAFLGGFCSSSPALLVMKFRFSLKIPNNANQPLGSCFAHYRPSSQHSDSTKVWQNTKIQHTTGKSKPKLVRGPSHTPKYHDRAPSIWKL